MSFTYTIPKQAKHPLAGITLFNGALVTKDGEDHILFAGQQPLAAHEDPKKYKKGDLYVKVAGKTELEKSVAEYKARPIVKQIKSARLEQDSKATNGWCNYCKSYCWGDCRA